MANGTTVKAEDARRWQLLGIAKERTEIQERLDYLTKLESDLRGSAMTGSVKPGKITRKKRVTSPETRKKMSEAQQRRHAKDKQAPTPNVSEIPPAYVPPSAENA